MARKKVQKVQVAKTNPNNGNEYERIVQQTCHTATMTILAVFEEGKQKNKTSLWDMSTRDHAIRSIKHIKAYLDNDESEPHLQHALWRIAATLFKDIRSGGENVAICPRCGNKMEKIKHPIVDETKFHCCICKSTLIVTKPPTPIIDKLVNNEGEQSGIDGSTDQHTN